MFASTSSLFPNLSAATDVLKSCEAGGQRHGSREALALSWRLIRVMSTLEDDVLFALLLHHPSDCTATLQRVLGSLDADSTQLSPAEVRDRRQAIATLVARLILIGPPSSRLSASSTSSSPQRVLPDPQDVSSLLERYLSSTNTTLFSLAATLYRFNIPLAHCAVTGLLLQCPPVLLTLRAVGMSWLEAAEALTQRATTLAQAGRHQRTQGDVVAMLHSLRRVTMQLWAWLTCCPVSADYIAPARRLMTALRDLSTVASMCQHFVFTCEALNARRPQLIKVINAAANWTMDCAALLLVFVSHGQATTTSPVREAIESQLIELLINYGNPTLRAMLASKSFRLRDAFAALTQPQPHANQLQLPTAGAASVGGGRSGGVDGALFNDMLVALLPKSVKQEPRFARAVMSCAEAMGMPIAPTQEIERAFAANSGSELGEGGEYHAVAGRGAPEETAGDDMTDTERLVRDVVPHLPLATVRNAIKYYGGSVERLIEDALIGNLPPHLLVESSSSATSTNVKSASSGTTSAAVPPLAYHYRSDGDSEASILHDVIRAVLDDDNAADFAPDGNEDTRMLLRDGGAEGTHNNHMDSIFGNNGGQADRFLLTGAHPNFMYEDERDDGADGMARELTADDAGERQEADDDEPAEEENEPMMRMRNPNRWRHHDTLQHEDDAGAAEGDSAARNPTDGASRRGGGRPNAAVGSQPSQSKAPSVAYANKQRTRRKLRIQAHDERS